MCKFLAVARPRLEGKSERRGGQDSATLAGNGLLAPGRIHTERRAGGLVAHGAGR